jgi:Ni/Fe-hydrogenase subunit HybB-like protein
MKNLQESFSQQSTVIKIVLMVLALGIVVLLYRFVAGLGMTNMSDGYPWGIWITIDVVVGTALGTGGFLMAILIYLFNKWEYTPLIRSAIMTSAFGYTIAGISVIVDIGRWWNFYTLLLPWRWNTNSVLFEVAICIMAYVVVLWLEFTPVLHEKSESGIMKIGLIRSMVNKINEKKGGANKILIFLVTVGILLPLMHQSSLGSVMAIAKTKLHGLWHTPFLPLLFIISIGFMGYSMVVIEAVYSSFYLKRKFETNILKKLAPLVFALGVIWVALRFYGLASEGKMGLLTSSGIYSIFFWIEMVTAILGSVMVLISRTSPKLMFISAGILVFSAVIYRIDAYLIGYKPFMNYSYTPAAWETLITLAFVAAEFVLYHWFLRVLPILPDE